MAKIILSAFADEYSHNLAEQIEALKAYGFTHLEPRFISGRNISTYTDEEARALRKALDGNGISVYSLGSPLGKISLDDDFAPHLDLTERVCKIANILGASRIRMFSFYLPEGKTREQCRPEVLERLCVRPEDCVMVGNDVSEDMIARELGMKVFLLTDSLINKENKDISDYPHGSFEDLMTFIREL